MERKMEKGFLFCRCAAAPDNSRSSPHGTIGPFRSAPRTTAQVKYRRPHHRSLDLNHVMSSDSKPYIAFLRLPSPRGRQRHAFTNKQAHDVLHTRARVRLLCYETRIIKAAACHAQP